MPCPACKIIIDGGRLAAAAKKLSGSPSLSAAATYLSEVVTADTEAIIEGVRSEVFTDDQVDAAHAWSELQCHRAAFIEDVDNSSEITSELLTTWATEDRLHATQLAGGEYPNDGAWEIDGVKGIRKKE